MTDYHPVTKEELEQIRTRHKPNPLGEGHGSQKISMGYWELDEMVNKILSRPDPLALLQKWRDWKDSHFIKNGSVVKVWEIDEMIQLIRENPEAVRQQGIKEGWWVE